MSRSDVNETDVGGPERRLPSCVGSLLTEEG